MLMKRMVLCASLLAVVAETASSAETVIKTESFDRDPGWEAHNTRIPPEIVKPLNQDFGFQPASHFAGTQAGEVGGTIWRAPVRASYAAPIAKKTLADKLSASGTFALTATGGSSGAFIGWFDSEMPGDGRQGNLGIHFAGQGEGARLTLRLVTLKNQSCGTKVTECTKIAKGEKVRPPSLKNDGTRYTFRLDYDPEANHGDGQMQFTMKSNHKEPQEFEGKTFTVPLPKGYKQQGTKFDRFGIMNTIKPGNSLVLHLDDLTYDDKTENFSQDPSWIGVNNHFSAPNREWGGAHDFGFSSETHFAGGSPGEIGGLMWRSGLYAYYADRVGPLTMNDRLEASGKVVLRVAPPDSGIYLGWFNAGEKEYAPTQAGNFVGVKVGGPTKVGHYFLPAYAVLKTTPIERVGVRQHPETVSVDKGTGPVFVPERVYTWKVVYDPAGNKGKGTIETTLGDESTTLNLNDHDKEKGALLDRFGLFTTHRGGSFVRIYFDDLKYTAGGR